MILYHGITNYHILCCILHKIIYNNDKECVLYISRLNKDKKRLEKTILDSGIFRDVKIFQEFIFTSIKEIEKGRKILDEIIDYVNDKNEINFNEVEEYNICGDHYALGMYLVKNSIQYNYFEDACGILSQKDVAAGYTKKTREWQYDLTNELKLFGESNLVINRYGDLSKQVEGYYNNKDIDFCIPEILKKLSKEQINKIINIFQDNITDKKEDSKIDLLLTQYFIGLGYMTYDEQKLLYTLLVDYFGRGNQLVIKPHPSDVHGLYKQWFPNSIVLNRTLPSELLPYCVDNQFETGITASSTAIYGLSNNIKNIIHFDNEIEVLYPNINRYYITLLILNKILNEDDNKIYLMGCYKQFLTNLSKVNNIELPELIELKKIEYLKKIKKSNRNIFIVDDLSKIGETPRKKYKSFQKALREKDIVIYINSNKKQYFYNEYQLKILKDIIPIVVERKQIEEDFFAEKLDSEYIYVYSKNSSIKEILSNMSEKIILENTGIELNVNQTEKIEMKTLEGILKATETRLKEEINTNKKLRKENAEIQEAYTALKNSLSWKVTKPLRKIKKVIKKK